MIIVSIQPTKHSHHSTGRGLLEYVRCEYQTLIMVEYPEVAWEPWKFVKSPNGWWLSVSRLFNAGDVVARTAVLVYFEHISKMHGITNLQEWREMRAELMNETEKRRISFLGKLPDVVESLYGGQISAGITEYFNHTTFHLIKVLAYRQAIYLCTDSKTCKKRESVQQ